MNFIRLPASALVLLLLLYAIFGWFLAIYDVAWWVWLAGLVASVAIARVPSIYLGRTGVATFGLAMVCAIAAFFVKDMAQTARTTAVGLAFAGAWVWAVGGTRYRMEKIRLPRSITFWTIILISWEGFWVGWMMDTFLTARFGQALSQTFLLF